MHLLSALVLHLLLLMSQLGVSPERVRCVLESELLGRYRLSRHREAFLGLDQQLLVQLKDVLLDREVEA